MSVDGTTHPLPDPFIVVATQNPVEYEGTYPLPEAQLDRFLFKLVVGYPTAEQEQDVLARHDAGLDPHDVHAAGVRAVAGPAVLAAARDEIAAVRVDPAVLAYIVALTRATRESPSITLGVSPRGAAMVLHAAKAWAWLSGRPFVTPDEVKAVARPAMRHRIQLRAELELEGATADGVLDGILATVPDAPMSTMVFPSPRGASPSWPRCSPPILLALPGNGWTRLVVVNGILLGIALVDAALAPSPAKIPIERTVPGVLSLGAEGEVAWAIVNPTVARADGLDRRPAGSVASRRHAPCTRAHPSTRAHRRSRTTIRPKRRGHFDIHDLTVRTEGPLGLAARQQTRNLPSVLRVLPPFKSRDEAELRINRARILEVGLRSAQGRGAGTEFDQLREYAPDDEFRRIDWSATARTGKVIVRTYRAERNQTVLLLLDSGRVMAGQVDGVPRLEHAMDAVMMLTAVSTRLGDRTGMLAFGRTVRAVVPPSGGHAQLGRITDAMYDLDAQLAESNYRAAFTEAMARFRRRALRRPADRAHRARHRRDVAARTSRDGAPSPRHRRRRSRS